MSNAHPVTAKSLLALLRAFPMLKGPWIETEPLAERASAEVDIDLERLSAEPPPIEWIRLDLDEGDEAGWTTRPDVRPSR
jgi:hypothetical protein